MNEMILECDENEEKECENKYVKNFIHKRQKVDGIFSQLIKSGDVRSKSFQSLKNLNSDRSITKTTARNVILENLEEYSSDDY